MSLQNVAAEVRTLVCATRASALALWQTRSVIALLGEQGIPVTELHVSTKGDLVQDRSLASIGTDNIFIKELENALRERRADFAVHSCKDLASRQPDDMQIAAITSRADPRDAFCSARYASLDALPRGARVGTSSPRREMQLRELRPDLDLQPIRGNVDTRLRKLNDGAYDAIVLAMAGLTRLGVQAPYTVAFDPLAMIPAVGQGALALECRSEEPALAQRLDALLGDPHTTLAVRCERSFLRGMNAGCQAPIGAHATFDGPTLTLRVVLTASGDRVIRHERSANVDSIAGADALGASLARDASQQRAAGGEPRPHAASEGTPARESATP